MLQKEITLQDFIHRLKMWSNILLKVWLWTGVKRVYLTSFFCTVLPTGKLLLLTEGFRLTRQKRSNNVLALNCEKFKTPKQQNDIDCVEWKVEGTLIAQCYYRNLIPNKDCGLVKEPLEVKGVKVLNYSKSDGALSITRSSPTNTSRPSVTFLCAVITSKTNNVHRHKVTVDFSVEYLGPQTTPSTSSPTFTQPALQGNDSFPKVQTESGAVVGRVQTLPLGKSVHEYLGIPYAEPPVGELRFAAPKPAKPWPGKIKETKEFGAACPQPQLHFLPSKVDEENEDCLFLNVFVPSTIKPDDKVAVMVWIHGGEFVNGSSTEYPGHVLAAFNDVIVVTFNYRLGILGFLSNGTDVKGNFGMFDQILALKWVQKNIASFGGDPKKVTVFGEGAGGMSVALHLISPKSRDLFQKAIMQSGAASSPYLTGKAASVESVKTIATAANCPSDGTLIGCLRKKNADEIISLQANLSMSSPRDMKQLTSPIVDGDFLPDSPQKLYKEGKFIPNVSVITGFTSREASLGVVFMPGNANKSGVSKKEFEASVTSTLKDGGVESKLLEELVQYQYTDHSHPHNKITATERMIAFQNDFMVVAPMIFEAKALAKAGRQTYLYLFEHRPDFFSEWVGAVHGVDIGFVFGAPFTRVSSLKDFVTPKYSDIEKGFSWYIMKLWTDFVKFGSPTPSGSSPPVTWRPFTVKDQFYLSLDVKPRLKQKYRAREVAFWNRIVIPKVIKQAKKEKEKSKE